MANKSIKRNYIYNLIQQILTLITPLVTAPYISRVLGADGIGRVSFTSSIVSYFLLFASLGISSYAQREISYNQDNRKQRTEIFWNVKILSIITTIICSIFYFSYIFLFDKSNTIIYFILYLSLFETITSVSWVFTGMEEFGITVARNIISRLLNVAVIFIFVHKKEDIYIYVFALTLTSFLCNLSLWTFIPKFIGRPNLKQLHPFKDFKVILSLFLPTIAISIYTVLDKTMIGIFSSGSYENGYYEQATKLSKMVLVLVTSLGTVMVPRIGHHFEKKETELVREFMYRSYRFVWFLGIPLCLGLIGVSPNFIPWFYGKGFEKVIPLLSVLSFLILAIGINNVTGVQYFIPTKRQNLFTLTVIIGAATNLVCNAIFIPHFQSIGAAIGSIVAESIIAIIQLWIVRKELSSIRILQSGIKYAIAGLLMYALLRFENYLFMPSITATLIMILSGSFIYFILLFIMRDKFFLENLSKITAKLLKRN